MFSPKSPNTSVKIDKLLKLVKEHDKYKLRLKEVAKRNKLLKVIKEKLSFSILQDSEDYKLRVKSLSPEPNLNFAPRIRHKFGQKLQPIKTKKLSNFQALFQAHNSEEAKMNFKRIIKRGVSRKIRSTFTEAAVKIQSAFR